MLREFHTPVLGEIKGGKISPSQHIRRNPLRRPVFASTNVVWYSGRPIHFPQCSDTRKECTRRLQTELRRARLIEREMDSIGHAVRSGQSDLSSIVSVALRQKKCPLVISQSFSWQASILLRSHVCTCPVKYCNFRTNLTALV